ncbi:copper chaperone CopZ [Staphylococcus saccharolyticus]|uniref:copper chaperone CopZ n=1 Tax=Staphylococcus saccharolyticus TaxID=33028 RepID=UPI00102DFAEC|nr:copper chaperone CopZ [Staphylococcus saccharolyticus]MBL7573768.1 copper chaperone CopZ [Staphylococcus saccharolyticus]MBL7584444.1 copper chaperone CopZ [Staphylococcus saccharolyticus]MBL7639306.1 copper chaperone CopZ [Staphylococcus saccharolyticus]QRJ68628.1 copper chaperone CopZ [Staphylococcus saccharolyticus]TAA91946.1 copper resistance protein CopZ [Staphylococcus saccharolyticus]
MTQEIIQVEGMSCEHCKNAVESALAKLNGVSSAEVNLAKNNVRVEYNDSKVNIERLKEAIEDQGYDVK